MDEFPGEPLPNPELLFPCVLRASAVKTPRSGYALGQRSSPCTFPSSIWFSVGGNLIDKASR